LPIVSAICLARSFLSVRCLYPCSSVFIRGSVFSVPRWFNSLEAHRMPMQLRCGSIEAPMSVVKRIAVWSGPRNISTAMMRSWGNRPDTFVCDEPFYALYLWVTGRDHPGADEVIANGETN